MKTIICVCFLLCCKVNIIFSVEPDIYGFYQAEIEMKWLGGKIKGFTEKRNTIIDRNGKYVEIEDSSPLHISLTYNQTGKVDKLERSGTIDDFQKRLYDANGQITSITVYRWGRVATKTDYQYNRKGNLIKELVYYGDGTLGKTSTMEYNPKNKSVVIFEEYVRQNSVWKIVLKYNSIGYPIERTSYKKMGTEWHFFEKRKFEYEYDPKSNWIKKTEYDWVEKFGKSYFEPVTVYVRIHDYLQ